jgi:hypothetical protein
MSTPDPYRLFAYYHLGFDDAYRYRFRNLHHTAAQFGLEPAALKLLLAELRMDAETVKCVDFNLASAHADAQGLDLDNATVEAREAFARDAYARFQTALAAHTGGPPRDDIDWDALEQGEP